MKEERMYIKEIFYEGEIPVEACPEALPFFDFYENLEFKKS